jgi:hypothetical protein
LRACGVYCPRALSGKHAVCDREAARNYAEKRGFLLVARH